jgi:hypothetical protein
VLNGRDDRRGNRGPSRPFKVEWPGRVKRERKGGSFKDGTHPTQSVLKQAVLSGAGGTARRKISAAVAVKAQKTLGHLDHLLLLAAGQFGNLLENLLEATIGDSLFWLDGADPQQRIDADPEGFGHLRQNPGAGRLLAALPKGDVGKRHTELVSELPLREPSGLAQLSQVCAHLGLWTGCRSAFCHVAI